ncbi:MAG: hypothetical protein RIT45_1843 [Pseudomonadota bacterium]
MMAAELVPLLVVGTLALLALTLWLWRSSSLETGTLRRLSLSKPTASVPAKRAEAPVDRTPRLEVPPLPAGAVAAGWREDGGRSVLVRPDGSRVGLTLEPALQRRIESRLHRSKVPYAAVVVLDPKTGAVLAMAEKRAETGWIAEEHGLLKANAPAASVFKLVTSAALLETGVRPDATVRYHGGSRGIEAHHLTADRRDNADATLSDALARSINPVFAKLAVDHLTAGGLAATAEDLLFGHPIPFDMEVEPSRLAIEAGALALGRSAAGFEGSWISPLHAALLAAAVANEGKLMRPYLVTDDSLQPGRVRQPSEVGRALSREHARQLGAMMVGTVAAGSATRQFHPWPQKFASVSVAGKTGTLDVRGEKYAGYTWFVGFAPADDPKIAVAALAVNERGWWVRGPTLARHAIVSWLELHPEAAGHPTDAAPSTGENAAGSPAQAAAAKKSSPNVVPGA